MRTIVINEKHRGYRDALSFYRIRVSVSVHLPKRVFARNRSNEIRVLLAETFPVKFACGPIMFLPINCLRQNVCDNCRMTVAISLRLEKVMSVSINIDEIFSIRRIGYLNILPQKPF